MSLRGLTVIALGGLMVMAAWAQTPEAALPEDSPRRTPLVEAVAASSPAVVDIFGVTPMEEFPGSATLSVGTGSILHESGFIVTNAHVAETQGQQTISLHDGRQFAYRVICESQGEDLAIIKVDVDEPLTAMTLGRSNDLMLGESVIVIGNPGGLAHTVTSGIISGLGRVTGGEDGSYLMDTIQTDAAINGGNSGGPLINMEGEQIGVIVAKQLETEGLGFAIPIDRLRQALPAMLSAEMRYGCAVGLTVDTFGPGEVTAVEPGSPAEAAGIEVGDVITAVDSMDIRDGVHYYLALAERQAGEELAVTVLRDSRPLAMTVVLADVPPLPSVQVDRESLTPGLTRALYEGDWDRLPAFDELEPVSASVVEAIGLEGVEQADHFGMVFSGYVDVPQTGLYAFYVTSDDGARLYIGGELVVDNDGLHGVIEDSGMVRLEEGAHEIRVTFFEKAGDAVLGVAWQGPEGETSPLPGQVLLTDPPSETGQPVLSSGKGDDQIK